MQQDWKCIVTNTATNKGHSGSKKTKNKDGAEAFEILEIDFYSNFSFNFSSLKAFNLEILSMEEKWRLWFHNN